MPSLQELNDLAATLDEAQWKDLYLAHARRERSDVLPFPDDEIQVLTNNKKGEPTAIGAISIVDCILSCLRDVRPLERSMRVLDYGCGWGRMTRLLPHYFDAECITGVDVDERLIDSANTLLPFLNHTKIESVESLPFADDSFDLVYANSVFSHLSETACMFTLRELSRVLAKDGVLVVSVLQLPEMQKFYSNDDQRPWITKILGEEQEALNRLEDSGFYWGGTGRWPEYGIAIMTEDWIIERFASIGIEFRESRRREVAGSQNYKVGVKR